MSAAASAYHVAPPGISLGAIIAPGSWGRLVLQFSATKQPTVNPDWQVTMWEVALESSRLATAPGAASRLDCVFATEDQLSANVFQQQFRPASAVYKVEPVAGWGGVFKGDYSLITTGVANGAYAVVYPEIAKRYWTEQPAGSIELLIPCPVRVIARIS